jgi:hypothetical protein
VHRPIDGRPMYLVMRKACTNLITTMRKACTQGACASHSAI